MRCSLVLPLALACAACRNEAPACAPAPPVEAASGPSRSGGSHMSIEVAAAGAPRSDAVLAIEVAHDGGLSIEGVPLSSPAELTSRAQTSLRARPDLQIVVAAEKDAPYERVLRVLELVKNAGATRVALAQATPGRAVAAAPAPPTVATPSVYDGEPWRCPLPAHVDPGKGEEWVFVRIHVDASGNPEQVDILEDPGRGLGEAARACAMQRSYRPAIDEKGRAVAGQLKLRIRYSH